MSLVAKLLPLANVLPDLAASSKKRLFEQVGLLFENQHGIARGVVFESLFARERLGSTGLGQGIAIPHGRIKGLPNDGAVQRIGELIEVATFVIYTCSVQHAAVNFPQYDCMSYTPNMPLAGYRPAPTMKTCAT